MQVSVREQELNLQDITVENLIPICCKRYYGCVCNDDTICIIYDGQNVRLPLDTEHSGKQVISAIASQDYILINYEQSCCAYSISKKKIEFLFELEGITATTMTQQYIGCLQGQVYMIAKSSPSLRGTLDSEIVQIQVNGNQVIISTLTRLVYINNTRQFEQSVQVGTRLRSNTRQGGCFYQNGQILAARPNCKIFQFDCKQLVVSQTLSFGQTAQQCNIANLGSDESPKPVDTVELGLLFYLSKQLYISYYSGCVCVLNTEDVRIEGIWNIDCVASSVAFSDNVLVSADQSTGRVVVYSFLADQGKQSLLSMIKSGFKGLSGDMKEAAGTEQQYDQQRSFVAQEPDAAPARFPASSSQLDGGFVLTDEQVENYVKYETYNSVDVSSITYNYGSIARSNTVDFDDNLNLKQKLIDVQRLQQTKQISPLTAFFPFLKEDVQLEAVDDDEFGAPLPPQLKADHTDDSFDLSNISVLSAFVAQKCSQINQMENILYLQLDNIDFSAYRKLQKVEAQALNKFIVSYTQHSINLLSLSDKSDPLYINVKQILQTLVQKAVVSLAAFMDIQVRVQSYDFFQNTMSESNYVEHDQFEQINIVLFGNVIRPPQEFQSSLIDRIQLLQPLMSTFNFYYLALFYHMPSIIEMVKDIKIKENDNTSQSQFLFCIYINDFLYNQEELIRATSELLCTTDATELLEHVLLAVEYTQADHLRIHSCLEQLQKLITHIKNVLGVYLDRQKQYISLFMSKQVQKLSKRLQYLIYVIVYRLTNQKDEFLLSLLLLVKELECTDGAIERLQDYILCQGAFLERMQSYPEFQQALYDFTNQATTQWSIFETTLQLFRDLRMNRVLLMVYAEYGYLDKSVELLKQLQKHNDKDQLVILIYQALLNKNQAAHIIDTFERSGIINSNNIANIIQQSIGIIAFKSMYQLAKKYDCMGLRTLREIGRVVDIGSVVDK